MGMIFAFGPDEILNTENVVVCSFMVINKQDITVKEVTNMKVVFENQVTGEEHELEAGPIGVHGMTHKERMDVVNDLIRELFKEQKR